ncbi:PR5-like receptor kinase [Hibiscus syriacus]|uniref:PR5-like receptor kinase n=1 Tax=Hibiscus syriacus TaxID=106335 RepID=A0A6A2YI52_HIBSY|nr:LEAF RUST 10 DISEASE-RESISTANCE LOCUS RECEPTOR-LIKE PROTEIN KINASE-like 2.3 [Hibiscus syriacus]KAE8677789.1 PR5-like receptor kinase [Hibiscus syriacus]
MPKRSKPKLPMHALVAAIVVLLQFPQLCFARTRNRYCSPAVCGNVSISYPFRLTTQPPNCGDFPFEIHCDSSNRTVLVTNQGVFYVQNISYERNTVRAIDPNLAVDDCSLPRGTLSFWDYIYRNLPYSLVFPFTSMYLVNCSMPVNSSSYIDASRCSVNSSGSDPPRDSYVYFLDERTHPHDFDESCRIEALVPIMVESINDLLNSDIYNLLKQGFEFSWIFPSKSLEATPFRALIRNLKYALQSYADSFIYYLFKGPHVANNSYYPPNSTYIICLLITGGFIISRTLPGIVCLIVLVIYKWRRRHLCADDTIEEFLKQQKDLMPIRYTYCEIERMSNDFKDKLGEGGYGSVFKGKLRSGYFVAIKLLGKSKGNGQDFINEVATIGRIHHVNVAKLIGFCVEGSKQALIYDFMLNGSLDRILFAKENKIDLSWKKMFDIAFGIARGIEYLHRGCDMQILHFDIKPHNILLDENFTPKVADFGLAKLFSVDASIVSITAARGTIGYIAPELIYKNLGGISYKADVYSFGMLLMEIIGRRKNMSTAVEHESQKYFPSWIYDRYYHGGDVDLGEVTDDEKIMVKKMVIVASWCVQIKPNDRPSMSKVLEMLETDVELLQMPPQPFQLPFEVPTDQSHGSNTELSHENSSTGETSALLYSSNEISIDIL